MAAAWLLAVGVSLPVSAASGELMVEPGSTEPGSAQINGLASSRFKFNLEQLAMLTQGDLSGVLMPDGQRLQARATRIRELVQGAFRRTVLALEQGRGALELAYHGGRLDRARLTRIDGDIRVFEAAIDQSGLGEWIEQDPNDYFCIDMPVESAAEIEPGTPPQLPAAPAEEVLASLQSKPAANHVLYLNFWGGVLSGTYWNDVFNTGEDIVYSPYSNDTDTGSFSDDDRKLMWMAWLEVAEDYAPFDVNVTTDSAVYAQTPGEDRSMLIATRSDDWYPGTVGGIADRDSFGNNYSGIAWVWNKSLAAFGQTLSHEAGHQMGLYHDGTQVPLDAYYDGHGTNEEWGPIMGAPYGKTFVQWSKGEYDSADNSEDDLAIIRGKLGEDQDVIGDTTVSAQPISSFSFFEGRIEPEGLIGGMDTDVYSFTLASPQSVQVEIKPLLGDYTLQYGSNLALDAQLLDSSQSLLAQSSQAAPYYPQNNVLAFDGPLAADTYYLVVTALSPNSSWTTGFGEYDNAGRYTVLVSSGIPPEPDLTAQLHVEDSEVYSGQAVRMTAAVQNRGTAIAPAGKVRFYASTDDIISAADSELLASDTAELPLLEYDYVDELLEVQSATSTVFYGVCVDAVAGENVVGNNCSAAVEFTVTDPGVDLNIGDAVEQPALTWLRGGEGSFYRETDAGYHEGDSARSGAIDGNQVSWIQSDFQGNGWVRFDWKVSSEDTFDFLRFYDNDEEIAAISGEAGWSSFTHGLSDTGPHRLQWRYDKDPFTEAGADAGWVDRVEYYDRQFSIGAYDQSKAEGDSGSFAYQFTVQSEGASSAPASIAWAVSGWGDQPADADDFPGGEFPAGLLEFSGAETTGQITILVAGDQLLEPDESFVLTLSAPSGALLGSPSTAISMILDDDDDDGDGVADTSDNCPLTSNPGQADSDGDLVGDACDDDDDDDEVPDGSDNCPLVANPDQLDSDGDLVGNACDDDDDDDEVPDGSDNCPLVANPDQLDSDGDLVGNACDDDDDDDEVPDGSDNCPLVANPGQLDSDGDLAGDACDPDDDEDGVLDSADNCPLVANSDQSDSDGDQIGDACDDDDFDGDGILDYDDNCPRDYNPDQQDLCTLCFPVTPAPGSAVMICL